jgi:replicative DNA helicase
VTLVPMLDLRPHHPFDPEQQVEGPPAAIEAEQALLGILLFDNAALHQMETDLKPDHFYEPFHSRLFRSIHTAISLGLLAEPVVLMEEFRRDPAFAELGGLRYLADLVDRSPPAANIEGYASSIAELASLRELIRVGEQIAAQARGRMVERDEMVRLSSAKIIEGAESALMQLGVGGRTRQAEVVSIGEAAAAVITYVDDRSRVVGVKTGLNPLDIRLGFLMPGDLVALGGRPSMGKSAVALAASLNTADPALADFLNGVEFDGRPAKGVMDFQGEMNINRKDGGQVARRHLANVGFGLFGNRFPSYKDIRDKKVSVEQRGMLDEAARRLQHVPLRSIKRTGMTLSTIRSIARRQFATWQREGIEPGLAVIDHAGLIRPDKRTSSRYEAQTEVAIGAKELADELGVPVLVLIQLSATSSAATTSGRSSQTCGIRARGKKTPTSPCSSTGTLITPPRRRSRRSRTSRGGRRGTPASDPKPSRSSWARSARAAPVVRPSCGASCPGTRSGRPRPTG